MTRLTDEQLLALSRVKRDGFAWRRGPKDDGDPGDEHQERE